MMRMALDTETRQLLANARDVRAFVQDKDFEHELARLQEFITVCEKLMDLKRDGVLDAISDTILKLIVK